MICLDFTNQQIDNFPKFQAYILAEVALIEKLRIQNHRNIKNSYLVITSVKDHSGKQQWKSMRIFINRDLEIAKWVVLDGVVAVKEPAIFEPWGIANKLDILNYTNIKLIDDNKQTAVAMKEVMKYYIADLRHIINYNNNVNDYDMVEFKGKHLFCANAVFANDAKRAKCGILCNIKRYFPHKTTSSNKYCYVFDVQSGQQKFSIIDWELDPKYRSIFNNKIKRGEPAIFYKVEYEDRIKDKPYMMVNNLTYILHNFCGHLKHLLTSGTIPSSQGMKKAIEKMHFIWMNPLEHDIEDWTFFKRSYAPTVPTFEEAKTKVKEIANKDARSKGQVYFYLYPCDVVAVCDGQDMDGTLKHYCADCNKVNIGLNPICTHIITAEPWLEITAPIVFKYEKVKSAQMKVIVVLNAIKNMYDILVAENIQIDNWSEISQFVLKTFENDQIWNHESQCQYFIPIIHAFYSNMKKFNVKLKLKISVSGRYTNYYMEGVSENKKQSYSLFNESIKDENNTNNQQKQPDCNSKNKAKDDVRIEAAQILNENKKNPNEHMHDDEPPRKKMKHNQ